MSRRQFIKLSLAVGAISSLPSWAKSTQPTINRPLLPIPALLLPNQAGNISLRLQTGSMQWDSARATQTWGVNGNYLGPAIRLKRGQKSTVTVDNALPEISTIHWHGLEIPGESDGGPQAEILPGKRWQAHLAVDQAAATCWFHPHTHAKTGKQVAMGLGGLVLIDDEESLLLPLPKEWGIDDIPLIIQDKKLNEQSQIDYQLDVMSAAIGWFGDRLLVNGVSYPQHLAPKGWLRLRLLNGCNARTLELHTSDKRPLYVIGSDGGLLAEPVKLSVVTLLPGERFEVLVENSTVQPFDIIAAPVSQMGMNITPFDKPVPVIRILSMATQKGKGLLPDALATLPALPPLEGLPKRFLQLSMDPELDERGMKILSERYGVEMPMSHGHHEMAEHTATEHQDGHEQQEKKQLDIYQANRINGTAFEMNKHMFAVKQGVYERWTISGEGDMMLHPFHIHGTQFRILSENGQQPALQRRGWKDIVSVEGKRSEVLVHFKHLAPQERAYMAHCHLLEHEDTGMMLSFTVEK